MAASFHSLPANLRLAWGVIKTPRLFWRTASRAPCGVRPYLLFCFELLRPRHAPHPSSLSLREKGTGDEGRRRAVSHLLDALRNTSLDVLRFPLYGRFFFISALLTYPSPVWR